MFCAGLNNFASVLFCVLLLEIVTRGTEGNSNVKIILLIHCSFRATVINSKFHLLTYFLWLLLLKDFLF